MNALQSYSSDEECGGEAPQHRNRKSGDPGTNYDDVGMDISEDSDDELASNSGQARDRNTRPGGNSARHPGTMPHVPASEPPPASHPATTDLNHQHSEAKEAHRPSIQERLLGIASGGGLQRPPLGEDRAGPRRDSRSSPTRDRDAYHRRKSKSKSPKPKSPKAKVKSPKPRSPERPKKNGQTSRSRSKSREREIGRSGQNREHASRGNPGREQMALAHSARGRDSRRGRDDDRKRRDDDRRSRRSRSRSRSRDRRRSRSRSRSRSRERRRRSRSRERKRPMDIRKEAQQKLAALKAANPDLTAAELLKRSMEAQVEEVQKQTGITLPSYYNPAAMNPMKFAEQERKKKLLWGNKNKVPEGPPPGNMSNMPPIRPLVPHQMSIPPPCMPGHFPLRPPLGVPGGSGTNSASAGGQASLWANTKFSNDRDGKMAEKFRRLMGVKNQGESGTPVPKDTPTMGKDSGVDLLQKQETMFSSMERQYEMARLATHTHKGFGLGFTSQSFMPK